MTLIRGIENYLFSTDYGTLWELAQKQSVVCDVSYYDCRDIAQTICSLGSNPVVQVSARGISYVYADSLEEFVVGCQGCDLRWVVPEPTGFYEKVAAALAGVQKAYSAYGWASDSEVLSLLEAAVSTASDLEDNYPELGKLISKEFTPPLLVSDLQTTSRLAKP